MRTCYTDLTTSPCAARSTVWTVRGDSQLFYVEVSSAVKRVPTHPRAVAKAKLNGGTSGIGESYILHPLIKTS